MFQPRRALAALTLAALAHAPAAPAAKLVGIVSERSAPALAAAAEAFDHAHPGHELVLRTPEQLAEATDAAVAGLWSDADALLLGAVFGEAAPRFVRLLNQRPPPAKASVFAVASDRRLTALSRLEGARPLAGLEPATLDTLTTQPGSNETLSQHFRALAQAHPAQAQWLRGRHYWQARGGDNLRALIAWLLAPHADDIAPAPPQPRAAVRYLRQGRTVAPDALSLTGERAAVAVLDYDTGSRVGHRAVHQALCRAIRARGLQCVSVLAQWGGPSVEALGELRERLSPAPLAGVVTLQDFVIGGGEGRAEATNALQRLDVPVLKAIRLTKRSESAWRLAPAGLPFESVHYRVAMPEVQGQSQPSVVAAAEPPRTDPLTGVRLRLVQPIESEIRHLASRLANWRSLRTADNADKRIGLIFYNHPPGRHNIGADNLDVVASLFDLLHELKAQGYTVGELPASPEALLDMLQARAVNLPENAKALDAMSERVTTMPASAYRDWFQTLPEAARREMVGGPLPALMPRVRAALEAERLGIARELVARVLDDTGHMLEGVKHEARDRALDLLDQLRTAYRARIEGDAGWRRIERLTAALGRTGIEALGGWGEPPGYVMTRGDRILLPGIRFGNVFVGPQPPRGWELDEELLHANTSFPPPHQYLAFYRWLRHDFEADALVHLGRHSTYEFLPGNRVGMQAGDYSRLVAGDLPGIYPYIVDGVGEGIQAKRRGLAVMVDHLTPPLATTPLYDRLLEMRQLVESYESAEGSRETPAKKRALTEIRRLVDELDMKQALAANMRDVLDSRGIGLDEVEGDLYAHEVGHYLTEMQEDFMPEGLHVFGRPWASEAIDTMMGSIGESAEADTRGKLEASPAREMGALLSGLAGRFIAPGKGNDPVRSPAVLPTGRNFHALDGSLLPTRLAWQLGRQMAARARADNPGKGSEAVVLWASDTVRDNGAMVAFGLSMLGIKPVWNSRGILQGIERMALPEGRVRRDVVFTTSGLFRDLYQNLLVWLDRAVLLALDASSKAIRAQHPDLRPALANALEPLGELRDPGDEPIARNRVARHWIAAARAAIDDGRAPTTAGRRAALRVFGDAPGGYGAGVNRLAERSGAWQRRTQLADAYLQRMGHAYGDGINGEAAHAVFERALGNVERSYLGRASNVYGLLDNNDAFDYLGGLNLAVEAVSGTAPRNRVVDHSDPDDPGVEPLEAAVLAELQGRYLNPAWLKPLMSHGYDGARTMGSKFLENFWGWQVTNPDMITDGMWREIKSVYVDDKHGLGLDEFLAEGQNAHVKANMLAVMLVAMEKGFWDAEAETARRIAREFARLVMANGLPGSGHTRPDHPMLDWIEPKLTARQRKRLREIRGAAKVSTPEPQADPSSIRAVEPTPSEKPQTARRARREAEQQPQKRRTRADHPYDWTVTAAALLALLLVAGGTVAGLRGGRR